MKIKHLWKLASTFLKENDTAVLTGTAVVGVISTAIMAIEGGHRAQRAFEESTRTEPATAMERFLASWPYYAPATISAILTIGAIIGAQVLNGRKQAALVAAYGIAQKSLTEYREELTRAIGERKAAAVSDAVSARRLEETLPGKDAEIIITGDGEQLCFEELTSRPFKSSAEKIRRAENEFNKRLLHDGYASLNDFYEMLGLPSSALGETLGWTSDRLLDLQFSSHLMPDNRTALSIVFQVMPSPQFWRVGRS